jgi:hypothetical protein
VVEVPWAGGGDGELVVRGEFGEPAVHQGGVFLEAVFCLGGSFADAFDAVDSVEDGLGDEG